MPPWTPGDQETAKKYQEAIAAGKPDDFAARYAMGLEEMDTGTGLPLDIEWTGPMADLRQKMKQERSQPVLAPQALEAAGGDVFGVPGQVMPVAAAAGRQVEEIKQNLGGLPPARPITPPPEQPGALPGAQPGAQPGTQPGARRVGVAGSGPIGDIGKIAGQMGALSEEERKRAAGMLAPYTPPEGVEGSLPGLEGASAALDRASMLEEMNTLGAKPEKSIAELGRMGELATSLAAGTQQEKAAKEAETRAAGEKQLKDLGMQQAHQEVLRKNKVEEETEKLRQSIEDVKDWQLEPARLWKENWGQALASVFVGAMAQTWKQQHGQPGAENTGLKGVLSAVDRDIEAQKFDYQKRKGLVGEQRGVYADMMAKFKNERIADHAAHIALNNTIDRHLLGIQQQYRGTETADMARTQRTALQAQTADRLRQFQAGVDANHMQSLQAQGGMAATRASLSMQYQARQDALTAQAAKAAQGGQGAPLKDPEIKEIARLINGLDQVSGMHQKFDEHLKNRTAGGWAPDVFDMANREWNDYKLIMAQSLGSAFSPTGTVQARMVENYKDMVPSENDSAGRGHRQIDDVTRQLYTELKSKIQSYREAGKAIPPEWLEYAKGG